MLRRRVTIAVVASVLFGCEVNFSEGGCETCPPPPFRIEDDRRIQTRGRDLLLRGVNARIEGVFDVTFDDGRTALEPIPAFTSADAKEMAAMGFNFLRLPVNWSALEPERDVFDDAYLERIDHVVRLCEAEGIYVLLDFHQDAYSKEIGEDGAPLWAIVPPPTELLEGPMHDLDQRRTSKQVIDAFNSFFDNAEGLQDEFADAVAYFNARFANDPNVVGIEIMNEPLPAGTDNAKLIPFYLKVIDRTADAGRLWFFEPNVIRNQLDRMPLSPQPFPRRNVVYAPHIYTDVFTIGAQNFASRDAGMLLPSMKAADEEARAWGAPLLIGEFGITPHTADGLAWIAAEIDLQNRFLAHSAFWVWKENSQGSWGLFDAVTGGTWKPRAAAVRALTSPFPAEVEGELLGLEFDRATTTATAQVTLTGGGEILWAVPDVWYPKGAKARCGAKAAETVEKTPGRLAIRCPLDTTSTTLAPF